MDNKGVKQIIKFLQTNYKHALTNPQYQQLRYLRSIDEYSVRSLRKVFVTAISVGLCPECEYCHKIISDVDELTIDHTIPRAKGGSDNIENLQPMHAKCNSKKGSSMPQHTDDNTVEQLLKTPKPRRRPEKRPTRTESVMGHTVDELKQKCKRIDELHGCRYSVVRLQKVR